MKVSPSISISRKIVFSSLVGIRKVLHAACGAGFRFSSLRETETELLCESDSFGAQDVIDEPLPLLLHELDASYDLGMLEHLVSGLKHPLKV